MLGDASFTYDHDTLSPRVIARSKATKQSPWYEGDAGRDCFASLAMTHGVSLRILCQIKCTFFHVARDGICYLRL
jgi:hypothetical protein